MRRERAMTMIELLIVVVVMVIMLGIALPVMKTGIDGRRLGAAAETVVNQIRLAQADAAGRNTPVSVVLICQPAASAVTAVGTSSAGQKYAGDMIGSLALLSYIGPTGLRCQIEDASAGVLIHAGDLIRFNHIWHSYRVATASSSGPPWTFDLVSLPNDRPPIPVPANWWIVPPSAPHSMGEPGWPWDGTPGTPGTAKFPFVVTLRPQAIDSTPVELPARSCIDLSASGYGLDDTTFRTGSPIAETITLDFVPGGSLRFIRFAGGTIAEQTPMQPVYLSIGNIEAVGSQVQGLPENATNPQCRWVRIHPRSGKVNSLPVGWSPTFSTLANSRELED